MAKPPPTRTKSRAPVSRAPVKALSTTAGRKAMIVDPPKPPAPAVSVPSPKTAARTASAKPVPAKPVRAEPAVADTSAAKSKPQGAKAPEAASAAKKAGTTKTVGSTKAVAADAAKPEISARPSVAELAKPAPMPKRPIGKPMTSGPLPSDTTADAAIVAKPAAVLPRAAASVNVEAVAPKTDSDTSETKAAASGPQATTPQKKPAASEANPASLGQLPPLRLPEVASLTGEAVMSQALTMARAFGALQATMLNHACTELEATIGDAEKLARSDSASEAITLQAKAVRRSFESYAEHLKELARIASGTVKKD